MCKTYNMIGSLKTLKSCLEQNNIHDFKSLKEVINFQNSFSTIQRQLISTHENFIEQEKNILNIDLPNLLTDIEILRLQSVEKLTSEIDNLKEQLDSSISTSTNNLLQKLNSQIKNWNYRRKIKLKVNNFDNEVETSINHLVESYEIRNNRLQFIKSNFDLAVKQSAKDPLTELDRKKVTIDESNNYIYGALGEHKVVRTLQTLSDDYYLINDFYITFSQTIFNKRDNDYIKSIQIDHLLIAPSGIFLIETKNWSEKSLENLSLRSPVEQIKRTNFVLFKLLNNEMSNFSLHLENHHWGEKKISIKNLIVLTNTRPKEEFQYVKILTLSELLSYINYFKPIFSRDETQRIAEFLLKINDQKIV